MDHSVFKSSDGVHIADGGIYDNSGLITISDLIAHLTESEASLSSRGQRKQFVILAINAENTDYDLSYPHTAATRESWYQRFLNIDVPIRTGAFGYKAIDVMHFTNKRRAGLLSFPQEDDAIKRGYGLTYLPVDLSQFSDHDFMKIPDDEKLYARLKEIPTTYVTTDDDDFLLARAAKFLVSAKQEEGWKINLGCDKDLVVDRIDLAFTLSVLQRADSGVDQDTLKAKWCDHYPAMVGSHNGKKHKIVPLPIADAELPPAR